ncbi:preprotein translocase subunit SecE [bacterium]|nr:preprotein translocase subunit SecE [bacterium]
MTNPVTFLRESWIELKKVQTPTRQETIQFTMVVFIMLTVASIFLGLVDFILGNLMQNLLTR